MTPNHAKKIVKAWLEVNGFSYKLSAKTIDFIDLARGSCIFVKIHGWKPSPLWDELKKHCRKSGFCLES